MKPPVLTSPWKMGFFVSLMLVLVGIGVTFFFMRTFELNWGVAPFEPTLAWFQTEILSGALGADGFLRLIWPLLALVSLSSLLAHLTIMQGVRKYQRYLDSGLDYKNLLAAIRNIDDIHDVEQINSLRHHSDLKEFLLKVREASRKKTAELEEREKALENSVMAAERRTLEEHRERLEADCGRLVEAIQEAPDGVPLCMDLSTAELEPVTVAVRKLMHARGGEDGEDKNSVQMQEQIMDIVGELRESWRSAEDMERGLAELLQSDPDGTDDVGQIDGNLDALKGAAQSIEKLAAGLDVISEEAKGVAIHTALQAGSGKATQADVIQLAEDVKGIAGRFNETASSYREAGDTMKTAVGAVESYVKAISFASSGGYQSRSLRALAGRLSLWVERVMLLSDKVKSLQETETDGETVSVTPVESDDGLSLDRPGDELASPSIESGGFEDLSADRPLFSDVVQAPGPATEEARRNTNERATKETADDTIELTATDTFSVSSPASPVEESSELSAPGVDSGVLEVERFDRTTTSSVEETVAADMNPAPREEFAPDNSAGEAENDDATDLYALGAVDYDSVLHG